MKKTLKLDLQFFANLADVMAQHTDAFPEGNDFETRFSGIQSQLQSLGYDVLINNRAQAEFVPASRLSEVISQRDGFRTQFENAQKDLLALKNQPNIPEEAQNQIDALIDTNNKLLESLKLANINLAVVTEFDDAIDASDILQFIDRSKLKIDKDGTVTGGLKEEHERLKGEKPYLFVASQDTSRKQAGADLGGGGTGAEKLTMNALIRRAAYGSTGKI